MASIRQILAFLDGAPRGNRCAIVGSLGTVRRRTESGRYSLDFRPYGRVWSNRGIPITDEGTARRLLEQIRGMVADGDSLESVLARFQPAEAKANQVPTWIERWLDVRRREKDSGTLSPGYYRELVSLAKPGGHLSFFDRTSIHELRYGALEDWSLWLADRGLGP